MKKLWGEGEHQAEVDDLQKQKAAMENIKILSVLEVMEDQNLHWQLCILIIVIITLQFSGTNAVYFCTFEVLRTAGFEEGLIPYVSLGVGLCVFLPTLLCTFIIEQFGRKTLLCKGYAFMALALSVLTVTLSLQVRRNF
ncbi:solute carrier family 2, facilitated glucose transporter member 9-like [Harpia harpyja]|uniref:solute carrier family 2, facilitated glucose transporter member 9-like n=1 Tax=Harpia harpyja TaxID=202280 RepID=UPI0022B14D93|nr:solute carrier family 2, facilitated glucose transporter member 9-like [Harpia harpyja]